jgi:hypothetical protein
VPRYGLKRSFGRQFVPRTTSILAILAILAAWAGCEILCVRQFFSVVLQGFLDILLSW